MSRDGFGFIGIEREADYVEIARARVAHAAMQPRLDLFDAPTRTVTDEAKQGEMAF